MKEIKEKERKNIELPEESLEKKSRTLNLVLPTLPLTVCFKTYSKWTVKKF